MKLWIAAVLAGLALGSTAAHARPLTAKDMATLDRVSSPRISPDGHWLAYQVRSTDWAANKGVSAVWVLDLTHADAAPKKLDIGEASTPRWSPDSHALYVLSSRSKTAEIWRTTAEGLAPVQVTTSPVDISAYRISPNGKFVVFAALTYPDCKTLACTDERRKARADDKAEGEVYDRLGVRFWDSFGDGRYNHLFTQPVAGGEAVPLMGGLTSDTPSRPEGDESSFAISADSQNVMFAAHDPATAPGVDTRSILYATRIDGSTAPKVMSVAAGSDSEPTFSRSGRQLAYLHSTATTFGAARAAVMVDDFIAGTELEIDKGYDRNPSHLDWSEDGKSLYAISEDTGVGQLVRIDVATGKVTPLTRTGHVSDFTVVSEQIIIAEDSLEAPVDLYRVSPSGRAQIQLTHANQTVLSQIPMGQTAEAFTFTGWNGESVHGYVVKPNGWKPGLKYPVAFLIHGGPHGSFGDTWSYRWNPQAWAGMGYAVVMVDFHGSSGYGEAFAQSIVNHWGDRPLEDLQKGWAAAQAKYPWLDGSRACALGGSYGGYMVDWIAGNWNEPWKCLVDHDGILDTRLMAYATDIPGFSEAETGGFYWKTPEAMEKFNPINFLKNWSKPILVIHGGRDYRVPFDQGLGAFTAAQRKGVPSEFLVYASENHWVLKPQNSVQWYDTVGKWMKRWIGDTDPKPIAP